MYCKSCGKVLEGDPRFCMNCGAELYPPTNGRSNPNIDKSYLALWAVMGALIVGLFWVATRNSEDHPPSPPIDTKVSKQEQPAPPAPSDRMSPKNRSDLETDAKNAITHYADAVTNGKKSVAMSYWKNPSQKLSKQLDSLVSIDLISSKTTIKSERSAETWVDWVVSSTTKNGEHWRGTITQEKPGDTWLIASMKGMECIDGCGPGKSKSPSGSDDSYEGPSVQDVVNAYYEALSDNNGAAARSKWKTPPKLLNSILGKIDFATVNRIDDPIIKGTKASVWVDLTIKAKGKTAETWKGKVSLERFGNSGWLITSLSNMSKR